MVECDKRREKRGFSLLFVEIVWKKLTEMERFSQNMGTTEP